MFHKLRNNIPILPAWWVPFVLGHCRTILVLVLCSTAVLLFFTVRNFKIDTDLTEMVSNKLPFRQVAKRYHAEFPELVNQLVVVVESDIPEEAEKARELLVTRLKAQPTIFSSVYAPGSGPFFDQNGLLYLSLGQLEEQVDRLSAMQPFLALLSEDFSLPGLLSVLATMLQREEFHNGDNNEKFEHLFLILAKTITAAGKGETEPMSWQNLMLGNRSAPLTQKFILLQPVIDSKAIHPAKRAISSIREQVYELNLHDQYGVDVSITGKPAINHEDLRSVQTDISIASMVSLLVVGIVLTLGLGSARLVCASIGTLAIALIWTVAFAILIVGRLNMISVTFTVLFIGLGIDYPIQISLRYQELLASGHHHRGALIGAVERTANPLFICAISTAIGFYAFVPTAYVGASELGLISGTGMLIIFLASMTILPVFMHVLPGSKKTSLSLTIGSKMALILQNTSRQILATTILLALVAIMLVPRFSFDANPLRLSDPRSEAVQTALRLFENNTTTPWTISILAPEQTEAEDLARRLEKLPEVATAITIKDFLPQDQESKLEQIGYLKLILPQLAHSYSHKPADQYQESSEALFRLHHALQERIRASNLPDQELAAIKELSMAVDKFRTHISEPMAGKILVDRLQSAVLPNLRSVLQSLSMLMEAEEVKQDSLPDTLLDRYISITGKYRIQVFSENDLRGPEQLEEFVHAVQSIAPEATDQPVTILGAGTTILRAFTSALFIALFFIALFLVLVMQRSMEVAFVFVPILLALTYTLAAAVLVNIPLNFANIIIVPLLLGISVDASIHVIHRVKESGASGCHFLETSTSRGVFLNSLTTITSFGTLSFMHHAGTASMGRLLTLSVTLTIYCTLIVLPALLQHFNPFGNERH